MKIIDSHAHIVQYIAGIGSGGELRSIGNGKAQYANGQIVQMIPKEFGTDGVSPEQLLSVMDENHVEKAVLLQGNFYGFQNHYTWEAVQKYPDRFIGAASYDPYSFDKDGIRRFLFEELGFQIEKFEVSTGSGVMATHPDFQIDGPLMEEAFSYGERMGHIIVVDLGKCGSKSWQIEGMRTAVLCHPGVRFVLCHLLAPNGEQEEELKRALDRLTLPNVWFDLASIPHNCRNVEHVWERAAEYVRLAKTMTGADKLLFGTDIPSALKEASYSDYVSWIADMDGLTETEKEMILYRNAAGLYGSLKRKR